MKVKLEATDRFERDFVLRLPFRFGVITVTHGTQAVLRVRIKLEDGRTSEGVLTRGEPGGTARPVVTRHHCDCVGRTGSS